MEGGRTSRDGEGFQWPRLCPGHLGPALPIVGRAQHKWPWRAPASAGYLPQMAWNPQKMLLISKMPRNNWGRKGEDVPLIS